ncbi:MAG TPA: hypothetical protein PLN21_03560 [Gemmatales bacterium]|nr:hypothetical protein [Gemmatales bacterium]
MPATNRNAFCLNIILLSFIPLSASDDKVPPDQLPKAVVASVMKRFPNAKLVSASKATAEGKSKFEVTIRNDGMNGDINITEAGVITGMEMEMPFEKLPQVVSDTVKAKHPQAPVKRTEAVISVKDGKETLDYYEVIVTVEGKDLELEILPDGKIK